MSYLKDKGDLGSKESVIQEELLEDWLYVIFGCFMGLIATDETIN